jgi:hypothetical protein
MELRYDLAEGAEDADASYDAACSVARIDFRRLWALFSSDQSQFSHTYFRNYLSKSAGDSPTGPEVAHKPLFYRDCKRLILCAVKFPFWMPRKSCGLNGSAQPFRAVYSQESQNLRFFSGG